MIRQLTALPQFWLVLFALAGLGLGRLFPIGLSSEIRGAGLFLVVAGLSLMLWAAVVMRRARTTFIPGRHPDALVTHGPFRFSRNPIYLGDMIVLAGLFAALSAPAGLILLPGFAWLLQHRFIRHEEAMIAADFGAEFETYKARVRRWF